MDVSWAPFKNNTKTSKERSFRTQLEITINSNLGDYDKGDLGLGDLSLGDLGLGYFNLNDFDLIPEILLLKYVFTSKNLKVFFGKSGKPGKIAIIPMKMRRNRASIAEKAICF